MTLAQLASHATQLAGTPALDLSLVSSYVNIAYTHVINDRGILHQERETLAFASTATSDARIAVPADYDYALGLKIGIPNSWSTATSRTTAWKPLEKLPAPEFNTICGTPFSDASGTPEIYAEFASWLELHPSPDSRYSLQLRYSRRPASDMTASTATPILDEQWHWAVALKASELLAAIGSDTSREAACRTRYVQYVQRLRLDQTKRLMDGRGMRVRIVRNTY